jgi:uncharacterized protein YebE (UPF0316 family)
MRIINNISLCMAGGSCVAAMSFQIIHSPLSDTEKLIAIAVNFSVGVISGLIAIATKRS